MILFSILSFDFYHNLTEFFCFSLLLRCSYERYKSYEAPILWIHLHTNPQYVKFCAVIKFYNFCYSMSMTRHATMANAAWNGKEKIITPNLKSLNGISEHHINNSQIITAKVNLRLVYSRLRIQKEKQNRYGIVVAEHYMLFRLSIFQRTSFDGLKLEIEIWELLTQFQAKFEFANFEMGKTVSNHAYKFRLARIEANRTK